MGAYTYSGTAASNTSIDGIGNNGAVDPPSNHDNIARALAASQANLVRDLGGANTVAGTADAITVALADATAATSYFDGMRFSFRAASDTTSTTPTLNVDTIGAKTIVKTVQGAETALIAGDIQAGQTCEVVYRSAFASAAGAFELLNPSIESSIELGHATDTTLSRSAAGVMAVEGNVVPSPSSQAQYDMLVRGATSWDRLAIGTSGQNLVVRSGAPTWSNVSTFDTVKAATSGTTVDFTSIPSWVREIDVIFDNVSWNALAIGLIQLGDSGGIETTGYEAAYLTFVTGSEGATSSTSGFILGDVPAADKINLIATIKNITGNVWVCSAAGAVYTGRANISSGRKELSATLDRVRVTSVSANTFDGSGQINICYR